MHIKPLKHVKERKGKVRLLSVYIMILILVDGSEGDPRSQIIKLTCSQHLMNNQTMSIPNFVQSMEKISTEIRTSRRGTAITGTGPDSNYGLAECYGDLSNVDCILCYAEARSALPSCFPSNGGQIFLDGCFMRTQTYNFYQEYAGPDDTTVCGNTSKKSGEFRDSVRQAITYAVTDARRNTYYFARKVEPWGTANESAYVLADCWDTLNVSSCTECLERAFSSILLCLPFSEGRALHTGCFIRYSDTNFLNPEQTGGIHSDGDVKSHVIKTTCEDTRETNSTNIINFVQAMEDISTKLNMSQFGTAVKGTESDSIYGLGQCYGDISSSECSVCYAVARTGIPACLPRKGGRTYLNGCFIRYESYNFFGEITGKEDTCICPNNTRRNNAFERSAWIAVFQAVEAAPKNKNYHAKTQALISGTANNSVDAVADCWRTLDADSCRNCLQKAATSMLSCLPASEGYALYTGCFMRYSENNYIHLGHNKLSKGKIIAIVMSISFLASIMAFCSWKHRSKWKRRQDSNDDIKLLKIVNSSSLNFKYSTIEKATNSFDEVNKLGQGGFGTVYKGILPDGREIAVKRLFFNHRLRAGDLYNEVNIISSVDHKNLVKLVGFSCLGPESILIYEYLPNRSLDHFIFDAVRGKELNWAKRFDIIVGTAEGLAYLHENRKTRIIHRDIKAANILLDSKLRAKIADFGLARSFQQDKNHISTGIAGTLGYMAPEYIAQGILTEKVDVYSFGVLLLEVVTGMRNRGGEPSQDSHSLVSIAWKHFKQGSVDELFDPNLTSNHQTKKEMQSVVHIGLLCIQEVPSLRPSMSMALQMLSKNIEPLPSPANPPYMPESIMPLNELRANNPASVPTISHSGVIPR